jgi:hypothetical protein
MTTKRIGWKYPTKKINNNNNNNNNVPKYTKDKVYSAVVSPNNKCCLMMAHMWPKHVSMTSNTQGGSNMTGTDLCVNKPHCGLTHLLSYCKEVNIGHYGGVDPLRNRKRGIAHGWGTGNTEAQAFQDRVNVRWMRATRESETNGSSGKLTGNRSRWAGLKKGGDVAVGELKTGRKKNAKQGKKKMLQEQHLKKSNGDAPLGYSGRTALRREQCDVDGASLGKHPPPAVFLHAVPKWAEPKHAGC